MPSWGVLHVAHQYVSMPNRMNRCSQEPFHLEEKAWDTFICLRHFYLCTTTIIQTGTTCAWEQSSKHKILRSHLSNRTQASHIGDIRIL